MEFINQQISDNIATLILSRGKVNALNELVVEELNSGLKSFENDPDIGGIIITAEGNFFSFGFDIPEFLSHSKQEFSDYLNKFTDLYTYIFSYPKPIVIALNGHTIAGGCMLALACDYRVMVTGKAKISLNEINFGSTVFAGCTEMLRFWAGNKNATNVLYSGKMFSAEEAQILGFVDEVTLENDLIERATKKALELSKKQLPAFTSIKLLLRNPIIEQMRSREKDSINEFADIWYSNKTRGNLQNIKIH
jgi:3,2-trans-enoyl-CoA isomerase